MKDSTIQTRNRMSIDYQKYFEDPYEYIIMDLLYYRSNLSEKNNHWKSTTRNICEVTCIKRQPTVLSVLNRLVRLGWVMKLQDTENYRNNYYTINRDNFDKWLESMINPPITESLPDTNSYQPLILKRINTDTNSYQPRYENVSGDIGVNELKGTLNEDIKEPDRNNFEEDFIPIDKSNVTKRLQVTPDVTTNYKMEEPVVTHDQTINELGNQIEEQSKIHQSSIERFRDNKFEQGGIFYNGKTEVSKNGNMTPEQFDRIWSGINTNKN